MEQSLGPWDRVSGFLKRCRPGRDRKSGPEKAGRQDSRQNTHAGREGVDCSAQRLLRS